jgi:hypothetical protein
MSLPDDPTYNMTEDNTDFILKMESVTPESKFNIEASLSIRSWVDKSQILSYLFFAVFVLTISFMATR